PTPAFSWRLARRGSLRDHFASRSCLRSSQHSFRARSFIRALITPTDGQSEQQDDRTFHGALQDTARNNRRWPKDTACLVHEKQGIAAGPVRHSFFEEWTSQADLCTWI